jgi:hypothetical protein
VNHRRLVGLHEILSPTVPSLKALDLELSLFYDTISRPLAMVWEELEAMEGHNILEALCFFLISIIRQVQVMRPRAT